VGVGDERTPVEGSQMIKMIRRSNRCLLLWVALTILGSAIVGCEYFPESTFELSSESRLPKWINLPPGHTRADISLTMSYYINPLGRNVKFILQDAKKQTPIKLYGKEKDGGPFELKHPPQGFPAWLSGLRSNHGELRN
jgi:hypothetical protein